jgi:branched-chain amino acid transport system substrate-binding protein
VLARWLGLVALAVVCLGVAGCGSVSVSDVAEATGGQLTVYSSLPLQGPSAGVSEQIVGGEKLALKQAGGRAGEFKIDYSELDDASPSSGEWNPGVTATNAKIAAQDTSTIAYIGDFDSAATAVSLPFINGAGILQISPASPYVGLTSPLDTEQDEPERFYPSAKRTFVRLAPSDIVQAQAQVALMKSLGVRRLYVLDDQDAFEIPLADIVASDAEQAGITVLGHDSISTVTGAVFTGEVEKIAKSEAGAVFLAGSEGKGTPALWQALYGGMPHALLFSSSSTDAEAFVSELGSAERNTYIGTPVLPLGMYPPAARKVLRSYRSTFGTEAGPYVLYGYEAMTLVLNAVAASGPRGDDRQTVIDRVLATRGRNSVIGRYSIEGSGETTLSRYAFDRVRDGRLVFYRAIETPKPAR